MIPSADTVFAPSELKKIGRSFLRDNLTVKMVLDGNSMFPFLLPGDVGLVEAAPQDNLQIGDIVVFELSGKWIAHRLIRIHQDPNGNVYTAQGDSIPRPDASFRHGEYIGLIRSAERNSMQIDLNRPGRKVYGALVLSFGPIIRPTFRFFLRVRNRSRKLLRSFGTSY